MAFTVAIPKNWNDPDGIALTFVVSGAEGCNLRCPWCVVAQRREASQLAGYDSNDYRRFITRIAERERVSLVSVQGYEPLLPDAWPLAQAILKAGATCGSDTALITNGTHLAERADDLAAILVGGLTVSLDSADASAHDVSRGVRGSFDSTFRGIQAAMRRDWLADRLMVASVLRPGRAHELEGMPALLASLGVTSWVVTPLYRVADSSRPGEPVAPRQDILCNLLHLDKIARRSRITMLADDEFDSVLRGFPDNREDAASLRVRRLRRRDGVFRLSLDGSLSVGEEILTRVTPSTRRWLPHEDPYPLIVSARSDANRRQEHTQ